MRRLATRVAHHTRRATHHTTRLGTALVNALGEVCGSLARLTVISVFVITFLAQPSQIPTGSMEGTLQVGDFVLVNKQVFAPAGRWGWLMPYRDPHEDDILVFHYPVNPAELLVKRAIALPGDRVHLDHGHVILNGAAHAEPFAVYAGSQPSAFRDSFPTLARTDSGVEAAWWIELRQRLLQNGEVVIPRARYFTLGDNRNNSQDSRYWGLVPRAALVGEPMLIYLSIDAAAPVRERFRWSRMLRVPR